jgi:ABC-type sugar transport system substrate-binding protein
MNSGDYQELLWDSCQEAAQRYGFSVRAFWADNDSHKQLKQIQGCLNEPEDQRATIAMVSPVRETSLISTAHTAAGLGIGWVLLHRWANYMNELRFEFPRLPIFCVMPDQVDVGRIQARQFQALLPQGGKLVYIRGPLGTSSAMRRFAGVQGGLRGSTIELYPLNSDWTLEGGARAMRSWLQSLPPDPSNSFVVGAQNDAMAMGARQALEQATRAGARLSADAIPFCGCDGSPAYGQRLVREHKLTSTVILPQGAGRAVDEVAAMLDGGPRPPAQIVLAPTSFPEVESLARLGRGSACPV